MSGSYWYETDNGKQPGRILNGVVTEGILKYDWEQGSGPTLSKGKGSFKLTGTDSPLRLTGRWGVNQSVTNGGTWSVEKQETEEK